MAMYVTKDKSVDVAGALSSLANTYLGYQGTVKDRRKNNAVADANINKANASTAKTQAETRGIDIQNTAKANLPTSLQGLADVNGMGKEQLGAAAELANAHGIDTNDFLTGLSQLKFKSKAENTFSDDPAKAAVLANLGGVELQDQYGTNASGMTTNLLTGATDSSSGLTKSVIGKNNSASALNKVKANTEGSKAAAYRGIGANNQAQADQIIGLGAAEGMRKNLNKEDAADVSAAREQSDKAVQLQRKLKTMEHMMDNGFDTGLLAPVRAFGSKVGAATGLTDGANASEYETFKAISLELGAETLQLFGGSDTEKELEVALRTNPLPTNQEDANRNIINRKVKASSILQQKPVFQEEWLTANGSLTARDVNGRSFSDAWLGRQQELMDKVGFIRSGQDVYQIDQRRGQGRTVRREQPQEVLPKSGDVLDGYRYVGTEDGDRSDPNNWQQVGGQ